MSAIDDDPLKPGQALARSDTGYGNPPTKHRFQKGKSGNPNGRPKKKRAAALDPVVRPTDHLILEEAYRPVTIREGERTIELPAIQAAMRSLAISAMKGSRLSQKALAEIVREVEARKTQEHFSAMENAFEYKRRWTEELERRQRMGIHGEPDPIPHPDDIEIDMRTGRVRTRGPLDEQEKKKWDALLARRSEAQDEVTYFAGLYRRSRSPDRKASYLNDWHWEQRMFDIINDTLPERYKVELANRSYAQGASRSGKALAEFAKSKAMQKDYVGE